MLAPLFHHWYGYECDSNAKILAMLDSVPAERRGDARFQRAIDLMDHLLTARQIWLHRLGLSSESPTTLFPTQTTWDALVTKVGTTQEAWLTYLATLEEAELARSIAYRSILTGQHFRWNLQGVLTQLFGHACYHRGQIALLVADLGGEMVDTDYIFWSQPTPIPASEL